MGGGSAAPARPRLPPAPAAGAGLAAGASAVQRRSADDCEVPQPTCRICWGRDGELPSAADGVATTAAGRLLLGTCDCSGSLAAVHASCLLDWRRHAANSATCPTCRAPVRLPPGLAEAVRLPPLWRERLQRQLGEARARPGLAAFRCACRLVSSAAAAAAACGAGPS